MLDVSGGFQYWQPASRLNNAPMGGATQPWARTEKETRKAPVILEKEQQEGEGRRGEGLAERKFVAETTQHEGNSARLWIT